MLSRRQLLKLTGIGCGAWMGGNLHSALARLGAEERRKMINAIPGKVGEQFKRAGSIGYHITSQPANSPTFKFLQSLWTNVGLRTNGWLQIIMLPNSGELPAADTEAVLATASGRFDVITVAGPAIDSIMPQAIPLQALAFAYASSNKAKSVLNTPIYASCMKDAALVNNLHCLDGLLNAGMRQMTTIKNRPLHTIRDLSGLVLRIPPSPIYTEQLQPLGISTVMTPLSDALEAMKTGAVMGQENPVNYAVLLGFYKVCRFLNETNHFWSGFNTLINVDTWNQWPDSIQRIVQEEYVSIIDRQWNAIEADNRKATSFCFANGMIPIKTDDSGAREAIRSTQINIMERLDVRLQPIARKLIHA
jgi:TRAP-type C4-dicarboxylate transport system substrate-binding protein